MMHRQWGVPIVATLMWLHGASQPTPDQETFRTSVKVVPIYVSVIDDRGHLVTDLTQEDFQILDNGRTVKIAVFDSHVRRITGVLLLQALSRQFQREREAASAFVHGLASEDRISIGSLGREVAVSPILTGDKPTLSRILGEEFWPGGGSPLWRGIDAAMSTLSSEQGRRVIVLVTDDRDNLSAPFPDVVDHLADAIRAQSDRERRTIEPRLLSGGYVLYTVAMDGVLGAGTYLDDVVDAAGGGRIRLGAHDETKATMLRVVDELRHQYTVSFVPSALDGAVHQLEVRVNRKAVKLRFRRAYTATP